MLMQWIRLSFYYNVLHAYQTLSPKHMYFQKYIESMKPVLIASLVLFVLGTTTYVLKMNLSLLYLSIIRQLRT